MKPISSKNLLLPSLSLFTSLGTLFCCALPALFVVLGAGAALAGLLSNAPYLIVLSKYKVLLFLISGSLMIISGYLIWRSRNAPCPEGGVTTLLTQYAPSASSDKSYSSDASKTLLPIETSKS